ncbi:MAG: hypothetical protein J07HB67_01105 [halophilic archaeon J07HB67]|jgi:hypothetical protein|nr:MAG: hypothetical protein J07HB67_01105 [halophilic archaeon J07HB67]
MLYDVLPDAETPTAAELESAYASELAAVVTAHGRETVAADSGVDPETLAAFVDGEVADATLSDAAAVFGVDGTDPDAVTAEVRDGLLMGLSTAILDVDTVALEIDTELDAREVRQALEGEIRLRLDELAAVQSLIRSRS